MHAKAAVADSRIAFLTSANLTEAAFERNMELGALIRGGTLLASIDRLIDALVESGELQALTVPCVREAVPEVRTDHAESSDA